MVVVPSLQDHPLLFPSKLHSTKSITCAPPISVRLLSSTSSSSSSHHLHKKLLLLNSNDYYYVPKVRRPVSSSSSSSSLNDEIIIIPPNAVSRKRDPHWRGGFSLGVDLGLSRTGLALSKGFSVRPLSVLELRGQKLELRLLEIAELEEADEFIIGLPKSSDGKETPQSNKVRSVAGRLAARAADRGWRVYLQDEHGTSAEAIGVMIDMGLSKSARQGRSDAYAAMMVLERYFSMSGQEAELVLPKQWELQEKLRKGPPIDEDFYPLES